MICFNSRTHAGCDQKGNNSVAPNPMFQFTHPRGVRQIYVSSYNTTDRVSIHAPTRGATAYKLDLLDIHSVSIHAPTRGATQCQDSASGLAPVSIHAPTRGATIIFSRLLLVI